MKNSRYSSSGFVSRVRELGQAHRGSSWESTAARIGGSARWEETPPQPPRATETSPSARRPC